MSNLPSAAGRGHHFSNIKATDNARIHNGDVVNNYRDTGLEESPILTWLSPIGPSRVHNQAVKQYHPGTLRWFFDESQFSDWRDEEEAQALWCWGHVGTGKTTLVAQIPNHLRVKGAAYGDIALVYCRYAERNIQTVENLLGSILKQLYKGDKGEERGLPEPVRECYQASYHHGIEPTIHQLVGWLRARFEAQASVFVLVDAIDELDTLVARSLLRHLQYKNVKLLVTSRNIPLIKEEFSTYREIEIRSTDDDIRDMLYARIQDQSIPGSMYRVLDSPAGMFCSHTLRVEIVNKILASSRNMYSILQGPHCLRLPSH